jgi:predicted AAA+ superfamily ATPase
MENLILRAEALLVRLEALMPSVPAAPDWAAHAYRWRRLHGRGCLQAVIQPHRIALADLRDVDAQKDILIRNTRQFLRGLPANNALLTGARGTGKSSLVKALLTEFAQHGLRLVEVDKADLIDLPEITEQLRGRPERFILFCDDLSFNADEPGYKALKVALDGSIAAAAENMLIYATSNRRHLMPELMKENLETQYVGDEIRPGETMEEKISLSERFGLWLSFYPFDQDAYLDIVRHWLKSLGIPRLTPQVRRAALQFALQRGSRSGRVAWQFARDWAGQKALRD